MKTKYLISALALPALLAACTNDDFMESQAPSQIEVNDLLAGRGTVDLTLNATKSAGTVDTRVVGESTPTDALNWMWEPSDRLGGVVVDYGRTGSETGGEFGSIVDIDDYKNYVITNYNFNANITEQSASSTFSTPSAVVKGAYIFYNQYKPEMVDRGNIGTELDEYIDVKGGEEAGLLQVGTNHGVGQNFFISPIMNVAIPATDEGAKLEIPLALKSIYSVLRLRMKTDLKPSATTDYYKNGFRVYKIEVEPTKAGETFKRSFILNPADLAMVQREVRTENPTLPILPNGAIDATNTDTESVSEAINKVMEKIADPDEVIGQLGGESDKLIYNVTENGTFTSKDDVIDLLVLIPAGKYSANETPEELGGDGTSKGVLKVNIYTSQGVYRTYVMRDKDSYTFERGAQVARMCEMYIDGDKSNIDLYDFTENGFDVATTADWEYAIEYINNQYRDFGTSTNWNTPKLNLSNYKGEPIEVDAEHYFPNFRVIYRGNAVLNLVGQKEYSINPNNVIFGNGDDDETARPTITIEDSEASVNFLGDVKEDNSKGIDGTNYTAAIKLVSDATIYIAEDQKVNFEKLVSNTALNIAKGAVVNVNSEEGDTKTDGTVTLAEGDADKAGAQFNLVGNYQNDGTVTIGKLASLNQAAGQATDNNGDIIVDGELNINWLKNNTGATLTVKAWDVPMDNRNSGVANIPALTNNGSVKLEARKQAASGTYGGQLNVTSKLDNRNQIEVQGRLEVADMNNTGVITLSEGEYKYAWIQIVKGASTGNGKIVLANPADYEFYDTYFSGSQNLKNVTGVIEATLDAKTYTQVLKNLNEATLGNQERAWNVINKVIVKGELPLEAEMGELNGVANNKDFFLPEGASINAQEALTLASLTVVEGTAAVNAKDDNTKVTVEGLVDVKTGANLTIEKNVDMVINYNASKNVLNIAGTLTNEGWIDTEESTTDVPNYLNASITGSLDNNGQLCQPYTEKYETTAYAALSNLISALYNKSTGKGEYAGTAPGEELPRVELMNSANATGWNGWDALSDSDGNKVTYDMLYGILTDGNAELTTVDGYQAIKSQFPTNESYYYYIYLGGSRNDDVISDAQFAEWKNIMTELNFTNGVLENNPMIGKTFFYVAQFPRGASIDFWDGVAYGGLVQGWEGTISGDFTPAQ